METIKIFTVFILLHVCGYVFGIQTHYLTDHCGKTLYIFVPNQLRIKSKEYETLSYSTECRVKVFSTRKMMVYFKNLNTGNSEDCDEGHVALYDGSFGYFEESNPTLIGKFCGSSTPTTIYESSGADYLTIGYQDSTSSPPDFDIIVTEFHEGRCYSWETECSNGKCIDDDLACNDYNPCGDESDCRARTTAIINEVSVGSVTVVLLSVGSVIVVLLSFGICVYCLNRRNTGSTGIVVSGVPIATTMNSAYMTTPFGNQYNPPPVYNSNVQGMGTGVQFPSTRR